MMPAKPSLWQRLRAGLAAVRGYDAAKHNNHVWGGPQAYSSAHAEGDLIAGRSVMRQRARNADQNSPSARAIVESLTALIVSTGIDVYPDSGNESNDLRLREVWVEWAETASACGRLSLWELQRQAVRQLPTAGEWLWLIVDAPDRDIPFAIQSLEADQLSPTPVEPIAPGNTFLDGIEKNALGNPKFYHLTNDPAGTNSGPLGGTLVANSGGQAGMQGVGGTSQAQTRRVPAELIIHGFEIRRPSQNRGEPWLAPILGTLHQERQLVEAELSAAKIGAAPAIAITSPSLGAQEMSSGTLDLPPGSIARLLPGEDVRVLKNERPSQGIAPFRQMLRGDEAGAMRIPQRLIDRDVSRANYSSMRADMLDTRRQLDPVQQWIGRLVACEVYRRGFVQFATAAGIQIEQAGAARTRQMRCTIHPDGWQYVDPEKDVRAATAAIAAGLSTWTDEIGRRGGDRAKIWNQLKKDADAATSMGLQLDLSGSNAPAPQSSAGLIAPTAPPAAVTDPDPADDARMLQAAIIRSLESSPAAPQITINNHQPQQPAPHVTVQVPEQQRAEAPQITVQVPQQAAPHVTVQVPEQQRAEAPQITVQVPQQAAPQITVSVPQQAAPM